MVCICVVTKEIWHSSPIEEWEVWYFLSSVKSMQFVVREQSLSLGKVNQPDMEIKSTPLASLVWCSMQLDCSVEFMYKKRYLFLVRKHLLISYVLSAVIIEKNVRNRYI